MSQRKQQQFFDNLEFLIGKQYTFSVIQGMYVWNHLNYHHLARDLRVRIYGKPKFESKTVKESSFREFHQI